MKDIAKKTGLSLATVSRVFNEAEKVSPKTRNAVLKVAKELNFRPNKMASALRSGKSYTIGVVVPVIDNSVFAAAIRRMEEVLSQANYNLIISQSHESFEKEVEILENLKHLRVDGIIISVSKETEETAHIERIKESGIPVVLFDRTLDLDSINSVIINNYNGAYQATMHLIEQGCKRMIHLAGNEKVSIFKERRRGFEAALTENNLPVDTSSIIAFDNGNPKGIAQLKELLSSANRPDGIMAHGDLSALIAMGIIRNLQLNIPKDVALIGFGESSFCAHMDPGLSSVSQRNEDIGSLTAKTLLQELAEKENAMFTQQVLFPKLIIRDSSQKK